MFRCIADYRKQDHGNKLFTDSPRFSQTVDRIDEELRGNSYQLEREQFQMVVISTGGGTYHSYNDQKPEGHRDTHIAFYLTVCVLRGRRPMF